MNIDEYEWEPVPGLPEQLPDGERILWQGAPRWTSLARRGFHVQALAIYFGALLVWRALSSLWDGGSLTTAVIDALWLMPLAVAGLALLTLLAWLTSRTTIYTVTNRRLVMRFGIALPMTVNLPFRIVESAALRIFADGSGDVPIVLNTQDRIAYLQMWPHVRPWRLRHPQPMLRALPDPQRAADVLAHALHAFCSTTPARPTGSAAAAPGMDSASRPLVPAAS